MYGTISDAGRSRAKEEDCGEQLTNVSSNTISQRRKESETLKCTENGHRAEIGRESRTKPKGLSRFFQSLCCCFAPQRDYEKCGCNGRPGEDKRGAGENGTVAHTITPIHPSPSPQEANHRTNIITQVVQSTDDITPSNNPITQITPDVPVSIGGVAVNAEIIPHGVIAGEKALLPPIRQIDVNRKCLIIDLDETLVHSSFKPVKNADFVIPVEIDGVVHQVYVLKRPFVDEFLARVGEKFECVLFTASLAKYADPVADLLDKKGVFRSRLFREACVFHKGNYIKDLGRLGRDLKRTIIVDNSPTSYAFHPENAIPVQTWFEDPSDCELLDILPLLDRLAQVDSVYSVLRGGSASPDSAALLDRPYP